MPHIEVYERADVFGNHLLVVNRYVGRRPIDRPTFWSFYDAIRNLTGLMTTSSDRNVSALSGVFLPFACSGHALSRYGTADRSYDDRGTGVVRMILLFDCIPDVRSTRQPCAHHHQLRQDPIGRGWTIRSSGRSAQTDGGEVDRLIDARRWTPILITFGQISERSAK